MDELRIAQPIADRVDWRTSVADCLNESSSLLPAPLHEAVVAEHLDEYADWAKDRWSAGIATGRPDVLFAAKASRGLRPVQLLSLVHRAGYRGLVGLLEDELPIQSRDRFTHDEFQRRPLDASDRSYVLVSDVINFYEYIDHAVVHDEIVTRTGEGAVADTLLEFASAFAGRPFGLPQTYHPSHVLSDLVLDIPEHRLIRQGYEVWRRSDDFRICADSWSDVSLAYERLDYEVRQLGLSLNEAKSFRFSRDRYEQRLRAPVEVWDDIANEVNADLRLYDPYSDEHIEPDDAETLVEASKIFLELWSSDAETRPHDRPMEAFAYRIVLWSALKILATAQEDDALRHVRGLLAHEPHLTPAIARYLKNLGERGTETAEQALHAATDNHQFFLYPWQKLWLVQPLLGASNLSDATIGWLRNQTRPGATHSALSAACAVVLAQEGSISPAELGTLYDSVDPATRPEIAVAIAHACEEDDAILQSIRSSEPLLGWIVATVQS